MEDVSAQRRSQREDVSLSWQAPRGLLGLSLSNLVLRILTLGIYHFWAKTEVRKRIWSAVRINGEPLTYTGRGYELFLGFMIVFGALLLPVLLLAVATALLRPPTSMFYNATNLLSLILSVGFTFLVGIAIYRAQRYRLARTRWRGVRGSLEGSPMQYAWTYSWTLLLVPLTLGWILPWRRTKLQSLISNNLHFGDRPFRFDADFRPLLGPFAVTWFSAVAIYLAIVGGPLAYVMLKAGGSLEPGAMQRITAEDLSVIAVAVVAATFLYGLASSWYRARAINHFANHTHYECARFSGELTAWKLIWLTVTNWLILLSGVALLAVVCVAVALPFANFDNPRAPENAVIISTLPGLIPLVVIVGITMFSPIVQARSAGLIVRHLALTGSAPIAEIAQSAGADQRYGEGLAEAFDVDAF